MDKLNDNVLDEVSGGFISGDGVMVFQVNDTFYDKKFKGTSYKVTAQAVVRSLGQEVPVEISKGNSKTNGVKTASYLINSCTRN